MKTFLKSSLPCSDFNFLSSLDVFCLLFSSFFLKASKFYLKLLLLSLVDGTTGMSGGAVLGVAGVKLFFLL